MRFGKPRSRRCPLHHITPCGRSLRRKSHDARHPRRRYGRTRSARIAGEAGAPLCRIHADRALVIAIIGLDRLLPPAAKGARGGSACQRGPWSARDRPALSRGQSEAERDSSPSSSSAQGFLERRRHLFLRGFVRGGYQFVPVGKSRRRRSRRRRWDRSHGLARLPRLRSSPERPPSTRDFADGALERRRKMFRRVCGRPKSSWSRSSSGRGVHCGQMLSARRLRPHEPQR